MFGEAVIVDDNVPGPCLPPGFICGQSCCWDNVEGGTLSFSRGGNCDGIGVMRARGGCRRERVERACIDTGQPAVCGLLIVAGVTAIKQSLSLPKAD